MSNRFLIPPGAYDDVDTRIVVAVAAGRQTYADLAVLVDRTLSVVWRRVQRLIRDGVLAHPTGTDGTLHALYRPLGPVGCWRCLPHLDPIYSDLDSCYACTTRQPLSPLEADHADT